MESSLIEKRCDLEDGYIYTETIDLAFGGTFIDYYFMVEELYKPILIFTKCISLMENEIGDFDKRVIYFDYVSSRDRRGNRTN